MVVVHGVAHYLPARRANRTEISRNCSYNRSIEMRPWKFKRTLATAARWSFAAGALVMGACSATPTGTPHAVQIWSCRRDPATREVTFGRTSGTSSGIASMACPVSADGYLLATLHGANTSMALIRTPDDREVFITNTEPDIGGYSLHASGEKNTWTLSSPAVARELRLVRAFPRDDLVLLKADIATPRYFKLRKSPLPPGDLISVAANPLNGTAPPDRMPTIIVEGIPSSIWGAWFFYRPQQGDSGSPVLDDRHRLAGLISKFIIGDASPAPVTRASGIPADALDAIIRADRQRSRGQG
jgi:hypothetical protein